MDMQRKKGKKTLAKKTILILAFLGSIISFGMSMTLIAIFFMAVQNNGMILIDVISYGKQMQIFKKIQAKTIKAM